MKFLKKSLIASYEYDFLTSSLKNSEGVICALFIKLALNQKLFIFEQCYQCKLQNSLIINQVFSTKIVFLFHEVFVAD